MPVSTDYGSSSNEKILRGFQTQPIVLLNRINPIPFLTNIKVGYNKNGIMVPYSTVDEAQSRILRNVIQDSFVVLENIGLKNTDSISKISETRKCTSNLSGTVNKKNKKPGRKSEASQLRVRSSSCIKTNTKQKQQRCKKCIKKFNDRKSLTEHVKLKHSKPIYTCLYCSKKYVRRFFFDRHIVLHCKKCFELQCNITQYQEHTLTCLNTQDEEDQNYISETPQNTVLDTGSCNTNNVHTHTQPQITSKVIAMGSEIIEDVKYTEAPQSTATDEDIKSANNVDLNCLTDGMPTETNTKIHTNTRILRYNCQTCQKYFSTNFALLRHMKVHHILQNLSCKLCKLVSSLLESHRCLGIATEATVAISEVDSDEDCIMVDDDNPAPITPPVVSKKCNLPILDNIKTLQEDLVYKIVVTEVPIEYDA